MWLSHDFAKKEIHHVIRPSMFMIFHANCYAIPSSLRIRLTLYTSRPL